MKAMIFAAGLGTRLKPLTDSIPKALVEVAGKPLIQHVLEKTAAAGADGIVVNVHHFPQMICDWIETHPQKVPVMVSDESACLLETGGGIRHARPLLCPEGPCGEGFLVHNVDILSNLDIRDFVSEVRPSDLATLVVSDRKSGRCLLFDDDMLMLGWKNLKTGEVRSPYPASRLEGCRELAFAGIHHISDSIFGLFEERKVSDRFSITDFYIDVCARCQIRGYVPEGFRMMDVGKIDVLSEAEAFCRDLV